MAQSWFRSLVQQYDDKESFAQAHAVAFSWLRKSAIPSDAVEWKVLEIIADFGGGSFGWDPTLCGEGMEMAAFCTFVPLDWGHI